MQDWMIPVLDENSYIFNNNELILGVFRGLAWALVNALVWLSEGCVSVYNTAFKVIDFSQYEPIQKFINSFKPVFVAVICVSLFAIGIILIMNYEKRPKVFINIFMAVLVVSSSTYLFSLMNTIVISGKEAIISDNGSSPVYEVVKENIYDLLYIDAKLGLKNLNGKRSDYPTYETLDEKFLKGIKINDIVSPKNKNLTTNEAKDLLKYRLNYFYTNNTPSPQLEEIDKGFLKDGDWFNNYYYRYKVDWFSVFCALISISATYLMMGYKVFRILFELAIYKVVAMIQSAELSSSQKTVRVLEAIKNSYVVILITCILIKFYALGTSFINHGVENQNFIVKGFLLCFLAFAVIDGPNLIEKLYGIDAGLSSSTGRLMSGIYTVRTAAHVGLGFTKGLLNTWSDLKDEQQRGRNKDGLRNTRETIGANDSYYNRNNLNSSQEKNNRSSTGTEMNTLSKEAVSRGAEDTVISPDRNSPNSDDLRRQEGLSEFSQREKGINSPYFTGDESKKEAPLGKNQNTDDTGLNRNSLQGNNNTEALRNSISSDLSLDSSKGLEEQKKDDLGIRSKSFEGSMFKNLQEKNKDIDTHTKTYPNHNMRKSKNNLKGK